jgi:DNA-directed RNA polymerase specialized sigma24 family protein
MTRARWGAQKRQILALVDQGLSDPEIARRLGIRREAVSTARRRQGIPCRVPGRPGPARTARGDAMLVVWREWQSYTRVAQAFGCAISAVHDNVQRRLGT